MLGARAYPRLHDGLGLLVSFDEQEKGKKPFND